METGLISFTGFSASPERALNVTQPQNLRNQETQQRVDTSAQPQQVVNEATQNVTNLSAIQPIVPSSFATIDTEQTTPQSVASNESEEVGTTESSSPASQLLETENPADASQQTEALIRANQAIERVANLTGEESNSENNTDEISAAVEVFQGLNITV